MAAGKGERELRPPERESASRGRRRGRARAAAVGICHRRGRARVAAVGICRGGRETERKKKNGRDGRETSSSWMPVRDKVWYFSVLPLYFFKNYRWKGMGVHKMGWALLMGLSSKFRFT